MTVFFQRLRTIFVVFISLFFGLVVSQQTWAFSKVTHELVCEMAYQQLTAEARQRLDALFEKSELQQTFPQACAWADDIRRQDEFKHTSAWHYINVPRSAKEVLPKHCASRGCVTESILTMRVRLQNQPEQDWQALLFLSHLLVDLHQPLHVSYADDRGGNKTKVTANKQSTNLHRLWDGMFNVKTLSEQDRQQFKMDSVSVYHNEYSQPVLLFEQDVFIWGTESLQKTRSIYQQLQHSHSYSKQALAMQSDWMRARLLVAAARLTHELETVFSSSSMQLTNRSKVNIDDKNTITSATESPSMWSTFKQWLSEF
ncbi:MAG: S1/P1 nuclease [Oleibacter sp.]|nr:S1/P1 nuclease [Thalassolituus sp.]